MSHPPTSHTSAWLLCADPLDHLQEHCSATLPWEFVSKLYAFWNTSVTKGIHVWIVWILLCTALSYKWLPNGSLKERSLGVPWKKKETEESTVELSWLTFLHGVWVLVMALQQIAANSSLQIHQYFLIFRFCVLFVFSPSNPACHPASMALSRAPCVPPCGVLV